MTRTGVGWPSRSQSIFLRLSMFSGGKRPASAHAAYSTGAAWPCRPTVQSRWRAKRNVPHHSTLGRRVLSLVEGALSGQQILFRSHVANASRSRPLTHSGGTITRAKAVRHPRHHASFKLFKRQSNVGKVLFTFDQASVKRRRHWKRRRR